MICCFNSSETAFSNNGLGILDNDIINPVVTEESNGLFSLEFDYPIHGKHAVDLSGILGYILFITPMILLGVLMYSVIQFLRAAPKRNKLLQRQIEIDEERLQWEKYGYHGGNKS